MNELSLKKKFTGKQRKVGTYVSKLGKDACI
jgi:hypothetical protein